MMSGVSRYAYGITEKSIVRQQRHCKLCGEIFYSNKQLYCSPAHSKQMECFNNGRRPSMKRVALVLRERGARGAMLEDRQVGRLIEWNWIEAVGDGRYILSTWGETSFRQIRERIGAKNNEQI